MIGIILMIIGIVSAVWVVIVMPIYYIRESRPKSTEEQLNELAEACRYYMEKHPEVLDPYRTHQHEESEGEDGNIM